MARRSSVTAKAEAPATAPPGPDYDAPDVLVIRRPEQLKALADELRSRIVVMLRERAQSITELAEKLAMPKGTVGHHVKVLESAGLVRVVRTRRVRALTEKYYGRTARLFLYESAATGGHEDVRNIVAASLRVAAEEILPVVDEEDAAACSGVLRVRLNAADARRFDRRLTRLMEEFRTCDDPTGTPYGLALALYRRAPDA
jgi:DNA-binding transcriptional ArsR family regulator